MFGPLLLMLLMLSACAGDVSEDPAGPGPEPGPQPEPEPGRSCDPIDTLESGHTPLRRLSRTEYLRSIRDVLGPELVSESDPTESFPPDEVAFGFDNMGAVQRITANHLERYFDAAESLSGTATAAPAQPIDIVVEAEEARARSPYGGDISRTDRDNPGFIYLIGNGHISSPLVPLSEGTYEVSVRAFGNLDNVDALDLRILEGDLEVDRFEVSSTTPVTITRTVNFVRSFEAVKVGFYNRISREQALPIVRNTSDCSACGGADRVCEADRCRELRGCSSDATCGDGEQCLAGSPGAPTGLFCSLPRRRSVLHIDHFQVRGPLEPPERNLVRDRLVTCDPTNREACSREILARVAPEAWRRPLQGDELDRLVALAMHPSADSFEAGLSAALQAVFLSPSFLFRVEEEAAEGRRLTSHEVATRLSYFLWGAPPDDARRAAADDGSLLTSLPSQVDRMLADEKAAGFLDGFVGQWLATRVLRGELLDRDPSLFPGFTPEIQEAMADEVEALFAFILADDRPLTELMSADYGFVSPALGDYYGVSGGSGMTDLSSANRSGGVLTSGGLLTLHAKRQRTSIVGRGNWVLTSLLCIPPPDPPDAVEGNLPEMVEGPSTLRERLAQHRSDPACIGCHQAMDNIGFGLEGFDAVGRFRTEDLAGNTLDTTGELFGRPFDGAAQLAETLANDERFSRCVAQQLATYGTGRSYLSGDDQCVLEELVQRAGGDAATLRSLIVALVESELFLTRRGEEVAR
ncbi:MAG: DUF1592 domain-containing protein [Myxococcota bacterium]